MSVTFGAVDRIEENRIEADFCDYTADILCAVCCNTLLSLACARVVYRLCAYPTIQQHMNR